jgi:hypothetical protein
MDQGVITVDELAQGSKSGLLMDRIDGSIAEELSELLPVDFVGLGSGKKQSIFSGIADDGFVNERMDNIVKPVQPECPVPRLRGPAHEFPEGNRVPLQLWFETPSA